MPNQENANRVTPHAERTHCPAGHEYSPENTKLLPFARKDGSQGYKRQCRACKKGWRSKADKERAARKQQAEQLDREAHQH